MLALTQRHLQPHHDLTMETALPVDDGERTHSWSRVQILFDFTLTEVFGQEGWIRSQVILIGSNSI